MLSVGAQPVFTATGAPNTYTSVLDRDNLTLTDSGVYRCEAQNIAGIGADNNTISVNGKYMYIVIVYMYAM